MADACEPAPYEPCPFDVRLNRVEYLVLPKMAIQAMPIGWRRRLEALLVEADESGLEAPNYHVLRAEPAYTKVVPEDEDDPYGPVDRIEVIQRDPWAEYRHATLADVQALSPNFRRA